MFRCAVAIAVTAVMSISLPSLAQQRRVPKPDRQGDYHSGLTESPNGTTSQTLSWATRIRSGKLNCRATAGTSKRALMQFKPGELISADAGTDKSGDVIVQDAQGNTWLRVKMADNQGITRANCFVRANQKFIAPTTLE